MKEQFLGRQRIMGAPEGPGDWEEGHKELVSLLFILLWYIRNNGSH